MIVYILKRSYGNALRRLRRSGPSKAIPEIISFIPVIENKFGLDGAKSKKIIQNVRTAYRRYLKLEKVRDIKFST